MIFIRITFTPKDEYKHTRLRKEMRQGRTNETHTMQRTNKSKCLILPSGIVNQMICIS